MGKGRATLVVGDKEVGGHKVHSARCFEGVRAGVVVLIANDFDPDRVLFGEDPVLSDFVYVSTVGGLHSRLAQLQDNGLRRKLVARQRLYVADRVSVDAFGAELRCLVSQMCAPSPAR